MTRFVMAVGQDAQHAVSLERAQLHRELTACTRGDATWWRESGEQITASVVGETKRVFPGEDWHLLLAESHADAMEDADLEAIQKVHHELQGHDADVVQCMIQRFWQKDDRGETCVVWSPARGVLLALRDPLGKHALYVYPVGNGFVLTNTYRVLEPWLQNETMASLATLASLLFAGTPATHREAVFRHLERVPPGHMLHIHSSQYKHMWPWWQWKEPPLQEMPAEVAATQYRNVLQAAVGGQGEEKTTTIELSGGMDSTSLAAAYRRAHPYNELHAINFADHAHDDDRRLAQLVAQRHNIHLHTYVSTMAPSLMLPDPFTGGGFGHSLALLADIGSCNRVISGHGGDVLFAVTRDDIDRVAKELGWTASLRLMRAHTKMHGKLPPFFVRERIQRERGGRAIDTYRIPWFSNELDDQVRQIYERTRRGKTGVNGRKMMFDDPKWARLFEIGDAGYHGRALHFDYPFFDLNVIGFLSTLPATPFLYNKYVARVAWRDDLPQEVIERPKALYQQGSSLTDVSVYTPDLLHGAHVPSWMDVWALQSFLDQPQRYPRWLHRLAHITLDVLNWAYHTGRSVDV